MRDFARIGSTTVRSRNMIVGARATSIIGVVDPVGVITSPAATKQFAEVLGVFVVAGIALGVGGHYVLKALHK